MHSAPTACRWRPARRCSNFTVGNNISIQVNPNFTPPSGTVQTLSGVISDGSSPGTLNMVGPGALVLLSRIDRDLRG